MPWTPGLIGMGLAALVATLVLWIGGCRGAPLALGFGYALGHAAVRGWFGAVRMPVPPIDAIDWLAWLALAATLWGLIELCGSISRSARWLGRLVLTVAVLGLLLGPLARNVWPWPILTVRLIGPGAGVLVVWGLLDALGERLAGGSLTTVLALVAGGSSVVLVLTGSLVLGELAGVLTAAVVVSRFGSIGDSGPPSTRGLVAVVVVMLAGLLLAGRFYSETPTSAAVLLAVAPLAAWIDRLCRLPAWTRALVRVLAVSLLVGLAIAIALAAVPGAELGGI
ncbi:MAG: hypothetical protein ABI353_21420 [Isosphaeraceae bacterium]